MVTSQGSLRKGPEAGSEYNPEDPYWFPVVSVTSYRKLSDLKQHKFIQLNFWRSEVWNQGIGKSVFLLGALGRIHFLAFFSFWRLPACLGSCVGLFLTSPWHLLPLSHLLLLTLTILPPSYKDLVMTLGPPDNPGSSSHLEILNVITNTRSPLSHKVTGSGDLDGGHYTACYRVWAPRI